MVEYKADMPGQLSIVELSLEWEDYLEPDTKGDEAATVSIPDGLILSLNNLGKVDIEYIADVTGESLKAVISALKGSIYQNPETWGECYYKGFETSEEYLSGNLLKKLDIARNADKKYNGRFLDNIEAIKKLLPPTVAAEDIYITLGSPWVPTEVIDAFVNYLFKEKDRRSLSWWDPDYSGTKHDELTGTWELPDKSRYNYNIKSTKTYGTSKINALHIIERTLNMKSVAVFDEVECNTNSSGKKRVVNQAETVLALEKQKLLIDMFQKWVWTDEQRKKWLESIFKSRFGGVCRRVFDGSFLQFKNMSPEISLYPYQKNAVARILFTPNTLLAHDVGSGKTYIMIAAGMELLRMGMSKKNMFVVPNNIVGQWSSIFHMLYPDAKLLVVEPKSFVPSKRQAVLRQMRDEVYDGIIIAYSCYEQIPLSKAYYRKRLIDEKDEIDRFSQNREKVTPRLKQRKKEIEKELAELAVKADEAYNGICFDEIGVTRLFVDEAHNFKNVPVDTKADMVLGINAKGSKKCQAMMDKVREVQRHNHGGGVVFATGTPVTNSITEVFVLQKYLQNGELAMLDLQSFDSWLGMFAERSTDFEIDVDTNSYRLATRFSKFHNLPELTALLSSVADFHQIDPDADIPEIDGYDDTLIAKTQELAEYLLEISERAEFVRKGYVSRKEDNLLKITTDGRKAALDIRLVNPTALGTQDSKAAKCVENVLRIYDESAGGKGVQLIFCDSSTPKPEFNLYDEIKSRLIRNGIPENEIAFIHSAETEKQRNALFKIVRDGTVRVLIGSTFKLGLGVNIQERLIALHHLDVPWRPADMTQREGRILRQGNTNKKVHIFRYITEGSFDAYSWQLLETKQRFITELLSGTLVERSGSDISDTVLNYAEVKALAVGNPLVKERVETANELTRYTTLLRKQIDTHISLERELEEIPNQIKNQEELVRLCEKDLKFYVEWKVENPSITDKNEKREEVKKRKELGELIYGGLAEHVLEVQDKWLVTYHGFDLVLPANMKKEKPYIWLERAGKYRLEMGDTKVGNLIRIDNFLNNLQEHRDTLKTVLGKHREREVQIREELNKKEDYSDMIESCKRKLKALDEKLGVNKDE